MLGRRAFQAVDRAADALEAFRTALQASGRDNVTIRRSLARNGTLTMILSDLTYAFVPEMGDGTYDAASFDPDVLPADELDGA